MRNESTIQEMSIAEWTNTSKGKFGGLVTIGSLSWTTSVKRPHETGKVEEGHRHVPHFARHLSRLASARWCNHSAAACRGGGSDGWLFRPGSTSPVDK